MNNGMPMYISGIVATPNGGGGNNIIASTWGNGIVLSTDNGTTWTRTDTGLATQLSMAITLVGSDLYAGSWGQGVWRRPLSEIISSVGESNLTVPKKYSLGQNYPNPFNPTTIIKYDVSKAAHLTLKVFNLLGQEVATLVDDNKNAGTYEVQFNGSKLTSGVYFYRLQVGSSSVSSGQNFVETKKLILMK
ncbi:MAG: T9SS type A sorting domain-containing protein [Ignavibacteriales bacterium]|nr:T9SS type A sorting domain-containing protein [Ignavibacteriales bacterium]